MIIRTTLMERLFGYNSPCHSKRNMSLTGYAKLEENFLRNPSLGADFLEESETQTLSSILDEHNKVVRHAMNVGFQNLSQHPQYKVPHGKYGTLFNGEDAGGSWLSG
ncbi:hypothetical protein RRG08_037529 [Elysia crispata]|uniref:Uncharacterized protein n=1 Tax=Elysia crispata TaxID=231223 RepID=A0AAE1A4N6_9GAST|nr:hypothetical protein RRG08_037529 [Elysia crispata]